MHYKKTILFFFHIIIAGFYTTISHATDIDVVVGSSHLHDSRSNFDTLCILDGYVKLHPNVTFGIIESQNYKGGVVNAIKKSNANIVVIPIKTSALPLKNLPQMSSVLVLASTLEEQENSNIISVLPSMKVQAKFIKNHIDGPYIIISDHDFYSRKFSEALSFHEHSYHKVIDTISIEKYIDDIRLFKNIVYSGWPKHLHLLLSTLKKHNIRDVDIYATDNGAIKNGSQTIIESFLYGNNYHYISHVNENTVRKYSSKFIKSYLFQCGKEGKNIPSYRNKLVYDSLQLAMAIYLKKDNYYSELQGASVSIVRGKEKGYFHIETL